METKEQKLKELYRQLGDAGDRRDSDLCYEILLEIEELVGPTEEEEG